MVESQGYIKYVNLCSEPLKWHGLYENGSKYARYLDPSTNAHPAKMSMPLADMIIRHLKKLNLLKPGAPIVDFMCGTARTGIAAELHGHPFVGIELESHFIDMIGKNRAAVASRLKREPRWTITQGDSRKLSELLPGNGAGVVSPPYGETNLNYAKNGLEFDRPYMHGPNAGYSAIISPPYSQAPDRIAQGNVQDGRVAEALQRTYDASIHGKSTAQIGNLPDKPMAGVVSPPYEDQNGSPDFNLPHDKNGRYVNLSYGHSDGQLGNESGETYLSAMLQVYKEAAKAGISPLVTVTKNPTKNHELRRLDLDTARLLETAGYTIVDYHRAVLFEEREQQTLDGDKKKHVKGQMSFFKQLSYQKGNVVADHEDVLFSILDGGK